MDDKFSSLLKRLELVTTKLESMETTSGSAAAAPVAKSDPVDDEKPSPMVDAFNAFISGTVTAYVTAAGALSFPETTKQAALVLACFEAQRDMLVLVSKCKKPDAATFQKECITATSDLLGQVQAAATTDRRAEDYNHRQAMAEAIPALGWVMVEKTPVPHVSDMWEAGAFCQTKILTSFKGQDAHITYAKAVKQIFTDLAAFVKEFHRTGLEWNPKGVDVKDAPKGGAPLAPPPPPPPPAAAAGGGGADATSALFAQINQGGAITSGLKKVTKGTLHAASKNTPIDAPDKPKPAAAPKAAAAPAKPPKCECVGGKKWEIEHQVKNQSCAIETDVKQVVYIYQCVDSVITVSGKTNAITLDGCKKVAIIFDSVVAGIELINCTSCKVQVKDLVQTVTVDKCAGTQIIFNRASLSADVVTAKCSETNIVVPGENEGDEFKEFAIAEQFVSKWTGATWDTNCMAHTG